VKIRRSTSQQPAEYSKPITASTQPASNNLGDQGEVLVVHDPVQGHLLPSAEQTAQSEHPSARTAALHGVETVISMPNGI
jgi:hypothetical protein